MQSAGKIPRPPFSPDLQECFLDQSKDPFGSSIVWSIHSSGRIGTSSWPWWPVTLWFYLQKQVELSDRWRSAAVTYSCRRWGRQTPPAYFLLAARRDCLWKINQCFVAPLCFLLADTHHINKLKLLDALSVPWLVFPAGTPEKDGSVFHNRSIWPSSHHFPRYKGLWLCSAVYFQDKYSCFLHISEVMERQHKALAAAHSLYTAVLKLQLFLFTSFTHPLCPKPLRYYTYQKAISNI